MQIPAYGASPYAIIYGRQVRTVVDAQILNAVTNSSVTGFAESMLPSLELIHDIILKNIDDNREQKELHNAKAKQWNHSRNKGI